jgi:hypothetical protein
MTKQKLYNILGTFNRAYINSTLGTTFKNLGEINFAFSKIFNELKVEDPTFLDRDYDLALVELEAVKQHTFN